MLNCTLPYNMFVEDPIQIFPDDAKMNCVLKFASDLYSLKSTATLLYTNDMKVLIDT